MTLTGDFQLFGNTLGYDCSTSYTPTVGTLGPCPARSTTDSGIDLFWQSAPMSGSASATTGVTAATARSTSVLSIPANAVVKYARIYWAAQSSGTGYDPGAVLMLPDDVTTVAVTADCGWVQSRAGNGAVATEYWYQSSADITSVLQGLANPRGAYTLSGVDSRALATNRAEETLFAGWWAVVFYEDPTDTNLRQLTLFDGLDIVDTATGGVADVTLGGFLVPNGGYDAKLGVVTYEGDAAVPGDSLLFEGYKSTGPDPTVLTALSDAQNTATNFFNGTRSWLGATRTVAGDLPQMSGAAGTMQSFDMDVVDLKANGAIHAGDDSARIGATTTQDVFALGGFITSVNTLRPSFAETVKTVVNLTRGTGVLRGRPPRVHDRHARTPATTRRSRPCSRTSSRRASPTSPARCRSRRAPTRARRPTPAATIRRST